MNSSFRLIIILLVSSTTGLWADHLEVRKATALRSTASAKAAKIADLSPGVFLELDPAVKATSSFYGARTPDGLAGFVARSHVRRHAGDLPGAGDALREPWLDLGDSLSAEEMRFARRHYSIGKPQALIQRVREGYALAHDSRLKIPVWVQYELSREDLVATTGREDKFKPDSFLPYGSRAELSDYAGSGFDRGHMAPAADMKRSAAAMEDSFFLSNMVPQVGEGFNRGIWADLEEMVRGWVQQRGRLTVITGPVFAAQENRVTYGVIGENAVAVPTHCFKIVVDTRNPLNVQAIAFLLPNQKITGGDLRRFIVPIDDIEKATGLDFLSALPVTVQKACEEKPAPALW